MSSTVTATLPNSDALIFQVAYTAKENAGVTSLVVISFLSLISVTLLLCAIALSAFTRIRDADQPLFVRTHVAAYFISLLFSENLQAIGSIMNIRWIHQHGMELGAFCTAQGVIKQAADIGCAIWIFVIILHTFNALFMDWNPNKYIHWGTLICGWLFVLAIVICGPAAKGVGARGPFYGMAGYWCWISSEYPTARITLGYLFILMAAVTSLVLSVVILPNIGADTWLSRFSVDEGTTDAQKLTIAKQMLPFPVAYIVLILPITTARFLQWTGHDVAFPGLIFCSIIYLLLGLVNALLFVVMQRIFSPQSVVRRKWIISPPRLLQSNTLEFAPNDVGPHDDTAAAVIGSALHQPPDITSPISPSTPKITEAIRAKVASATLTRFHAYPPTPLLQRSNSYDSGLKYDDSELSEKHNLPPEGVPNDIDASGRDSMEDMYASHPYQSPLDDVPLGSGHFPPIPEEYLSPRRR